MIIIPKQDGDARAKIDASARIRTHTHTRAQTVPSSPERPYREIIQSHSYRTHAHVRYKITLFYTPGRYLLTIRISDSVHVRRDDITGKSTTG